MKSDKNILIAFILNFVFSIFEFIGGTFTNSIAIISDSIHDMSDAISTLISYILERKSMKKPDNNYTYGYIRYSILGSIITNLILLIGSILVIYNAILRLFNPITINYNGMILLALFGLIVNLLAEYFTRGGHSLNQKSVNLHMLEDVLGWLVVLIGAIIMRFTNISIIDSILSILVSLFILLNVIKNFKLIFEIFMEKTPSNIDINKLKKHIKKIDNVYDIHHIHIWSIDGYNNYATMHIVTDGNIKEVKDKVKNVLKEYNIIHSTIEIDTKDEVCSENKCNVHID